MLPERHYRPGRHLIGMIRFASEVAGACHQPVMARCVEWMDALRPGLLHVGLPVPVECLGPAVDPQGLFEKTGGFRQAPAKDAIEVIAVLQDLGLGKAVFRFRFPVGDSPRGL